MKTSRGVLVAVLAGSVFFACSSSSEDVARSTTSLSRGSAAGSEPHGGGEPGATSRATVLAQVQSALDRYRDTKSEIDAQALETRFASSVFTFDRKSGTLEPRREPRLVMEDVVEGLVLATARSPKELEDALRVAFGDLVWQAAIGAPTSDAEHQLSVLLVARSMTDAFYGDSLVADGGVPPVIGPYRDAGTTPTDASAPSADAGRISSLEPIDWCLFASPRNQSLQEKLLNKAYKALARQAARHTEQTGEEYDVCPPSGIGREGFRARLRYRDLLEGELSGRATYGFGVAGGIMEVTLRGSDIGGADQDIGVDVSWGIKW